MMDMFVTEDFSLLVDDWSLGQSFELNQYDDHVKPSLVSDDQDITFIKTEPQPVNMLESFLDPPTDQIADPFGAEWMENADLLQFLDVAVDNTAVMEQAAVLESELRSSPSPPATPEATLQPVKVEAVLPQPDDKQGVHIASYEFLQSLLKQSELNLQEEAVTSKAAVQLSPPTSPEAQVAPVIDSIVLEERTVDLDAEFIGSPLSADDVESLLSSAAPSPSTVDTSSLYGDSPSPSSSTISTTITCQSSDLYQLVANVTKGQKSRGSPYSRSQTSPKTPKSKGRKQTASISPNPSELELELMSKKDRKKLQNKNAAIRYRQKKKEESDGIRTEMDDLETINTDLHEKVDQLEREVQYMKDLIREVQKARGIKLM